MNTLSRILLLFLTWISVASAAPSDEAAKSAQSFYDGYLKVLNAHRDAKEWILKSSSVTPAFKKAYASFMKEPDSDPIICGQDFPKSGFKASTAGAKGDSATVILSSKDASFKHTFKATFTQNKGEWLLAGTDDLKPK